MSEQEITKLLEDALGLLVTLKDGILVPNLSDDVDQMLDMARKLGLEISGYKDQNHEQDEEVHYHDLNEEFQHGDGEEEEVIYNEVNLSDEENIYQAFDGDLENLRESDEPIESWNINDVTKKAKRAGLLKTKIASGLLSRIKQKRVLLVQTYLLLYSKACDEPEHRIDLKGADVKLNPKQKCRFKLTCVSHKNPSFEATNEADCRSWIACIGDASNELFNNKDDEVIYQCLDDEDEEPIDKVMMNRKISSQSSSSSLFNASRTKTCLDAYDVPKDIDSQMSIPRPEAPSEEKRNQDENGDSDEHDLYDELNEDKTFVQVEEQEIQEERNNSNEDPNISYPDEQTKTFLRDEALIREDESLLDEENYDNTLYDDYDSEKHKESPPPIPPKARDVDTCLQFIPEAPKSSSIAIEAKRRGRKFSFPRSCTTSPPLPPPPPPPPAPMLQTKSPCTDTSYSRSANENRASIKEKKTAKASPVERKTSIDFQSELENRLKALQQKRIWEKVQESDTVSEKRPPMEKQETEFEQKTRLRMEKMKNFAEIHTKTEKTEFSLDARIRDNPFLPCNDKQNPTSCTKELIKPSNSGDIKEKVESKATFSRELVKPINKPTVGRKPLAIFPIKNSYPPVEPGQVYDFPKKQPDQSTSEVPWRNVQLKPTKSSANSGPKVILKKENVKRFQVAELAKNRILQNEESPDSDTDWSDHN